MAKKSPRVKVSGKIKTTAGYDEIGRLVSVQTSTRSGNFVVVASQSRDGVTIVKLH